jgi:hypothetical protein
MFNNNYQPNYYNSNQMAPAARPIPKKVIIFIAIAAVILIATIISLFTLTNREQTLTCKQTIGEGENTQTIKLTFKYTGNELTGGKMRTDYKIEDEFTEEYVNSIKSNVEEEQYYHVTANKLNEHELVIEADIKADRTSDISGADYEKTKSYLTSNGMSCN